MLENVRVKAYIDGRLKDLDEKQIAKQEEVLKYLTSVMRGEQTEQTLRGLGEGFQELINIEVGAKDRIKAAELLGKRYGLFTEKIDANVDTELTIKIDYGEADEKSGDFT